jgi:hypothetical protein
MPVIGITSLRTPLNKSDKAFRTFLQCDNCGVDYTYDLSFNLLKQHSSTYTEHKTGPTVVWVEGATDVLQCQNCSFQLQYNYGLHDSGAFIAGFEPLNLEDGWWQ